MLCPERGPEAESLAGQGYGGRSPQKLKPSLLCISSEV